MRPRGAAILASIASYQHFEPNPLGHAFVEALGPTLERLGFVCRERRDWQFSRPTTCEELVASLPDRTAPLVVLLSARATIRDGSIDVLHPHSQPRRRRTHVPLMGLVEGVRRASCGPVLVLASLSLGGDDQLAEARRIRVEAPDDMDIAVVCAGSRVGRSGLPAIASHLAELLEHGPRFLPRGTSHELVRMVGGGGRALPDLAAAVCAISTRDPLLLWESNADSLLPTGVVADLQSDEPGVVQDALQDLASFLRTSDASRRCEAACRLLTAAAAADEGTARLAGAVLRGGRQAWRPVRTERPTTAPPPAVTMVPVPAGEFTMGTDDPHHPAERPRHRVWLPAYEIARDPISREEFRRFVGAAGHPFPLQAWPADFDALPADQVSYLDAVCFCEWLTCRYRELGRIAPDEHVCLPTEAEWEKAARGVDGRTYPWGEGFDPRRCNSTAGGPRSPSPAGSYSPCGDSPYGVRDMAGNVSEWTSSLWGRGYRTPRFGYPYEPGDGREAETAATAMRRVVRGGAFYYLPGCVTCFTRNSRFPHLRQVGSGFRIAVRRLPPGACPASR